MADYKTHIHTAAGVSTLFSVLLIGARITNPKEIILYFYLGTIGGILPDIDADNSVAVKNIFSILAIFLAFIAVFKTIEFYSLAEIAILWSFVFICIKYLLFEIFIRCTVHRGIFHSIPAGVFFCILTTIICNRFFHMDSISSWFSGLFILSGYFTHLIIDELNSVNLSSLRIKWSFGSAFKLINFKKWYYYVVLYIIILLMMFLAPNTKKFMADLADKNIFMSLKTNLFPNDKWFIIHND